MTEWSAGDDPVVAEFVPAVPERADPVASLPERERLLYSLRRSVLESSGGVCPAEDCYALADLLAVAETFLSMHADYQSDPDVMYPDKLLATVRRLAEAAVAKAKGG